MSILVHGDASFSGQGVVYETMQMTNTAAYSTGGTIHVVINNQIGLTTNPHTLVGASATYCTDVAKSVGAPIFHVNGDEPEAVCRVMEMAADFRAAFGYDCVRKKLKRAFENLQRKKKEKKDEEEGLKFFLLLIFLLTLL